MRREGLEPDRIAALLEVPFEEVEKALVQMRSPRPETTRGTLNVTLAAHRLVMQERHGNEPLWQTVDRMLDELLRLRTESEGAMQKAEEARQRTVRRRVAGPPGPLLQLALGGLA